MITAGACASLALLSTTALAGDSRSQPSNSSDSYRYLSLFGDVFERVRAEYVEPVSDEELVESALNGMLTSLDPHSAYLNAKTYKDMQVTTKGEFGGLGIEVTMEQGWVKVVTPIDDTPAARAGLHPGDFITHLNGEAVQGLSLNDAVDRMRGAPNTDIRITVRREGQAPFDVTLTRAIIKIQTVKAKLLNGNIGYVRVTQFAESTDTDLRKNLDQLKKDAQGKMIGYVLDLRNNPGGLLDQAVNVSSEFLANGQEVVSLRARRPEDTQRFNAHGGDNIGNLPLVVLINEGSASASEIVSGALQDHHRATLMGAKSFGKGSVQTIIPLSGHGAMKITTARYYTPSGRSIQAVGIEPDIKVAVSKDDAVVQALSSDRVIMSEASLPHALKNDTVAQDKDKPADKAAADKPAEKPAADKEKTKAAIESIKMGDPANDYQLSRAIDFLKSPPAKGGKAN